MKIYKLVFFVFIILIFTGCDKDENIPEEPSAEVSYSKMDLKLKMDC